MTILFLNDWYKYPEAVLDLETKNRSWIELAYKYKSVGIKNHNFLLALHNPRLRGVDPHDPNLTVEQMVMIQIECEQNFWYCARNVWRAPADSGTETDPIRANRAIVSYWWGFLNHVFYLLTQCRQTGKSFGSDVCDLTLMNFQARNMQINLLTKDDILRARNIERLKLIYDTLPPYLHYRTKNDSNNTENFTIKKRGNSYLAHVPQSSEKGAYKLGRGLSTAVFRVDELPFQPHARVAFGSAIGAMGDAADKAMKKGEPYGIGVTTTAGKKDDPSGAFVYEMIQEAAPWSDHFFDAHDAKHLEEMIRKNSPGNVFQVFGWFNHIQTGKDDAWLKKRLEDSKQNREDANRDYFGIWTSGSGSSPLPSELIERLQNNIGTVAYEHRWPEDDFILNWYIPANQIALRTRRGKQVIGMDSSDAIGRDSITFFMVDVETGETLCTGNFNERNLMSFARWLVKVLIAFPEATIIPERRGSGVYIIDYLLDILPPQGIDPFKRIFNWVVNDPVAHESLYEEVKLPLRRREESLYVRAKKYFGFATSGSGETSRSLLYGHLEGFCDLLYDVLRDRRLMQEIFSLVLKNGRIDHPSNGHDDMVIAMLLAHWFLSKAKNLAFYGINPQTVLAERKSTSKIVLNDYQQQHQYRLRMELAQAVEDLKNESDSLVYDLIERKIRFLNRNIVQEDNEIFSVDAIINEIRKSRGRKRDQ